MNTVRSLLTKRQFCSSSSCRKMAVVPLSVPSASSHAPAIRSLQPPPSLHERLLSNYQKNAFDDQENIFTNWRRACLANLHKKNYAKARKYWVQLRTKERQPVKFCEEVFAVIEKSHSPTEHSVGACRNDPSRKSLKDLFETWKYQVTTYGSKGMTEKCYKIAIQSLSLADPEAAMSFLNSMREAKILPDVIVYGRVLHGLSKVHDVENILKCNKQMESDGIKGNLHTFSMLLAAFANKKDVDSCVKFLQKMRDENLSPSVRHENSLLHAYGKIGDSEKIKNHIETIKENANIVSYNCLLESYAKNGDSKSAINLFDSLPCEPDVVSYHALFRAIARDSDGDLQKSGDYFDKMVQQGLTATISTINLIVDCFARRGMADTAEEMLKFCEMVKIKPDATTFNIIIAAYQEQRNFAKVKELSQKMNEQGLGQNVDVSVCRALLSGTSLNNINQKLSD